MRIIKNNAFKLIIDTRIDLTHAEVLKIKYRKPDKTLGEWTAFFEEGTSIYYNVTSNDFNAVGTWNIWSEINGVVGSSVKVDVISEPPERQQLVTIEDFNLFTNNFEEDTVILKYKYIKTAQEIVENYLGYALAQAEYTTTMKGNVLKFKAKPVESVSEVIVDGITLEPADYEVASNEIIYSLVTKRSISKYTYTAGYEYLDDVPEVIKIVVLKIATLLLTEANSNIGVTGVSSSDGFSRTFTNYSNYQKHLIPLNAYRIALL